MKKVLKIDNQTFVNCNMNIFWQFHYNTSILMLDVVIIGPNRSYGLGTMFAVRRKSDN